MSPNQTTEFCIRSFEGDEFADDPADLGGATKFGITLPFLRRAQPRATVADLQAMTFDTAVDVAFRVLMFDGRIREIYDWRLRLVVFDFAFHAGEDDSIPALQRVLNLQPLGGVPALVVDGILGPKTLAHANRLVSYECRVAACAHLATRQAFHIQRSYKPKQERWLRGWLRRCTTLLDVVTR